MKMTTMIAAMCASSIMFAATTEELNEIPVKDVTPANASEVFDAAVAVTNIWKIMAFVEQNKISLEDAVHKTIGKLPLQLTEYAFRGAPATTNYTLQAEAAATIDYANITTVEREAARYILSRHAFALTDDGKAEVARAYAANKVFGAFIYCQSYNQRFKVEFAQEAAEAYEAAKPFVKTQANRYEANLLWWYGFNIAKDYDGFSMMYDKSFLTISSDWLWITTTNPKYEQYTKDILAYLKTLKPSERVNKQLKRFAKVLDAEYGNKNTTLEMIDFMSNSKAKLSSALYCNNADKLIEVLTTCDMSLSAKDLEPALIAINALDPDYKPAEVLKALKAVNQRYTLKLYDDRDTWEPVLSKVRAMIETRL